MIQYRPLPGTIDIHELHRQLIRDVQPVAEGDVAREVNGEEAASRARIEHVSRQLISMTSEIFPPGPFDISLEFDPDDPTDEDIVFSVSATGEFRDIFDREYQWHERANELVGEVASWLSICPYPR